MVVGLVVAEGSGLRLEVRPAAFRQDVFPDPARRSRAPGPELLAWHRAVIRDVHQPALRLVVVGAEPVVLALPREEARRVRDVLPPRQVHAVVDRPAPELVLAVARHEVTGVLGLRELVRVSRRGRPELERMALVGRVDEDVVAGEVAPPACERDPDQPAHPVDGLGLADPDGGAAVRVLHHGVVDRHEPGGPVPVREVPLDPAGDPGARHADQARLDRGLPVEPLVAVRLVERAVDAAAELREDHELDVLVLQHHGAISPRHLLVSEPLAERVGVDRTLRAWVDRVELGRPDLPGRASSRLPHARRPGRSPARVRRGRGREPARQKGVSRVSCHDNA